MFVNIKTKYKRIHFTSAAAFDCRRMHNAQCMKASARALALLPFVLCIFHLSPKYTQLASRTSIIIIPTDETIKLCCRRHFFFLNRIRAQSSCAWFVFGRVVFIVVFDGRLIQRNVSLSSSMGIQKSLLSSQNVLWKCPTATVAHAQRSHTPSGLLFAGMTLMNCGWFRYNTIIVDD